VAWAALKGNSRERLARGSFEVTRRGGTARYAQGGIVREKIEVGFQTFVSDGGEEFGAVRQVSPKGRPELVVYVENAGDFVVPLDAVESVHSHKVILNCRKLEPRLRQAIGHAHDAEEPGA